MAHTSAQAALRYQHVVSGQDEAIADYLDTPARAATSNRHDASEREERGTLVAREPDENLTTM
jgi:hypothetical protein